MYKELLWLNGQIRFYRNRFITHSTRPWQRGQNWSLMGFDYKLFIPSPPGWLDEEDITKKIKKLLPLAPQWLKEKPDNYWEKAKPRALLEKLLENICDISEKSFHKCSKLTLPHQINMIE